MDQEGVNYVVQAKYTSEFAEPFSASSMATRMASQAHFAFPLVQGSTSSFRFGVNIVGQIAFFSAREGAVNAEEAGTMTR